MPSNINRMGEVIPRWNGDGVCIGYGQPFASLCRVQNVNSLKSVVHWILILIYTLPFAALGL